MQVCQSLGYWSVYMSAKMVRFLCQMKYKIWILAGSNSCYNGTAHFYVFADYRGHHRKGISILNANKVRFKTKTLVLSNKNTFLSSTERLKEEEDLYNYKSFVIKHLFCLALQCCDFWRMFVQLKDAHCKSWYRLKLKL
jgi:hypothetical protein